MKHFTKRLYQSRGTPLFGLVDDDGISVEAFDHFVAALMRKEFAYSTTKRYMEVVSDFVDYLEEAKVFGVPVPTAKLNLVVESYLSIRIRANRIRATPPGSGDLFSEWARPIVVNLDLRSIRPNENLTAALNFFLRLSDLLARTELERAAHFGVQLPAGGHYALIRAVDGYEMMPLAQRKALKQSSMLANVMRLHPNGIRQRQGLTIPKIENSDADECHLDFPLACLSLLIAAATTTRDRALWTLLAASGMRTCEALALTWLHIDIENQKIYVDDPNSTQSAQDCPLAQRMRFKGRVVRETYLFMPLRDHFFKTLAIYVDREIVSGVAHEFVFQDVRPGPQRGRPMHTFSDTARNRSFKRAVKRANIPHPTGGQWGLHSLRHAYGVYLLNYLPVPGGYGLQLKDVQLLMGHKDEKTTKHYAREDRTILASKLEYADACTLGLTLELADLPSFIAARLRHEATKYETGDLK